MKSLFIDDDKSTARPGRERSRPDSFGRAAQKFVDSLKDELDSDGTKALAIDKVASPVLQVIKPCVP